MKKILVVLSLMLISSVYAQECQQPTPETVEVAAVADDAQGVVYSDSEENLKELFEEQEEEMDTVSVSSLSHIHKTQPGLLGYARVTLRYIYNSITNLV